MMLLFIGVQLLTFGLLAELLARTYYESQNKPVYAIREIRQTPELARDRAMSADERPPRRDSGRTTLASPSSSRSFRRGQVEGRQVPRPRDRPARAGAAARLRAGHALELVGARRARACSCVRSCIRWCSGSVGTQRRVWRQRHAAPSAQDRHWRQRRHRRQLLPRRQGDRQHRALPSGTGVFVGRNTILSCKNGDIVIDDHANLGFNCEVFSASRVRVGKSILMAAYTYLVGGDHLYDRVDIPVLRAGPHGARDRSRRQRLAGNPRGVSRRVAHRPRCDHRGGRRGRGRHPRVRDRDRNSGER